MQIKFLDGTEKTTCLDRGGMHGVIVPTLLESRQPPARRRQGREHERRQHDLPCVFSDDSRYVAGPCCVLSTATSRFPRLLPTGAGKRVCIILRVTESWEIDSHLSRFVPRMCCAAVADDFVCR